MFTTRIPWYCNGKEGKVPCLRKGASVCGKTIMMDEATRRYRCRRNTSIAAQELPDVGVRVRVRAQLCVFAEGRVRGRGTAAAVRARVRVIRQTLTNDFDQGIPPIIFHRTVLVLRQLPRMAHLRVRKPFEPPHAFVLYVFQVPIGTRLWECNAYIIRGRWQHIHRMRCGGTDNH